MKKTLLLLATLVLALCGCRDDDPTPELSLSTDALSFNADGTAIAANMLKIKITPCHKIIPG